MDSAQAIITVFSDGRIVLAPGARVPVPVILGVKQAMDQLLQGAVFVAPAGKAEGERTKDEDAN